jgi:predicted enzyme related to lactoylglutathione lyase
MTSEVPFGFCRTRHYRKTKRSSLPSPGGGLDGIESLWLSAPHVPAKFPNPFGLITLFGEERCLRFLNLVVLRAPDIEEAQRFYSLLGFSFTKHAHGSGPQHYAADTGEQIFEIYPQANAEDSTKSVRLGFKVPALDATVARLVEGGAKIISTPRDSPWGRRAVVSDSIGHKIELIEVHAATPQTA